MICVQQFILIGSCILGSWLGMQAIHELGHVCGTWLTGGHVERVALYPLAISRTDAEAHPAEMAGKRWCNAHAPNLWIRSIVPIHTAAIPIGQSR
jgi:hypothetical protein